MYNNKTTFNKTNLVLELKKNDIYDDNDDNNNNNYRNEEENDEHYFETDYYYKIDQQNDEAKQINDLEHELEVDANLNKAALETIS